MFVVAIAELASSLEDEARALAVDLGGSAYDARLLLAGGLPAVVRRTPDKAEALDLLGRLRGRGHGAVACDAGAVVAASAMVSMRHFRLGESAVTTGGGAGELDASAPTVLRYDDVLALIAAVHRTSIDTTTQVIEKKLSVSRAILTSGLTTSKSVSREAHSTVEEREAVLYLFRRSGMTPWILRENGTEWAGHGKPIALSRAENFRIATEALRERAAGAFFDDRLVRAPARGRGGESAQMKVGVGTTSITTSSEAGVDLSAHLIALWGARARTGHRGRGP
jgi:hypothetical protein